MAWNADATRMPAKVHSQYLRRLFLSVDLSEGRYPVDGKPVSIGDIALPVFCVGTQTDDVAPWRSVHKVHLLTTAEVTFVLTSGGHNAGGVSDPGRRAGTTGSGPAQRRAAPTSIPTHGRPPREGSWWPEWSAWLQARRSTQVAHTGAPAKGYTVLGAAPGTYVLER
jgi:polyhydroxyalkanoate synthase